jgi:hypothetical protein
MRAVRVSVHGRDVRGLKKWSHAVRSGPDVTIGCSGVLVGENLVFAPIGSLLDGWSDAVVSIDGVRASSWALLENTSSVFWDFKFCLITCSCSVDKTALPRSLLTVEQYAMHLTQPHWGLLVQPCRVVCQPASFVSLIDVSCYEGGEGGLVAGIEERFIVARGLMADGAPTGLSVCVAISHLLNLPHQPERPLLLAPAASPVVVVRGSDGMWGTGFAVGTDGLVVTAAHVLCKRGATPPERVSIVDCAGNGKVGWAEVMHCWSGGWMDVCVLKVVGAKPATVLLLSNEEVRQGQAVSLLSATQWGTPMRTEGFVMSVIPNAQIVSNVIAWGGCSGGALVNSAGHVVGLLRSTAARARTRIPRLSLILPTSLWSRFLTSANVQYRDDELCEQVEQVWNQEAPPLPPKFKEFVSKL